MKIVVGLIWLLSYFEDLQRQSQIKHLNISGDVTFALDSKFPRVAELKRWLTLTKLKEFTFRLNLIMFSVNVIGDITREVFTEYKQEFGDFESSYGNYEILVEYPKKISLYPTETEISDGDLPDDEDDNNTTRSSWMTIDESIDANVVEVRKKMNIEIV